MPDDLSCLDDIVERRLERAAFLGAQFLRARMEAEESAAKCNEQPREIVMEPHVRPDGLTVVYHDNGGFGLIRRAPKPKPEGVPACALKIMDQAERKIGILICFFFLSLFAGAFETDIEIRTYHTLWSITFFVVPFIYACLTLRRVRALDD